MKSIDVTFNEKDSTGFKPILQGEYPAHITSFESRDLNTKAGKATVFNLKYTVSEEVAKKIDKEIRKLVDEGYNKAKQILTDKIDDLHKIAKALMTYETLTGEEIENIINKNIYPADKQDLKVEDDKGSAMGALGLKPKIIQ